METYSKCALFKSVLSAIFSACIDCKSNLSYAKTIDVIALSREVLSTAVICRCSVKMIPPSKIGNLIDDNQILNTRIVLAFQIRRGDFGVV